MRTDLDQLVVATLHRRAEAGPEIDPASLLCSASVRGRRRRRRRHWAAAAGAFGAAAAVAIGVTAVPGMPKRPASLPTAVPQPSASAPSNDLRMPPATGQPGALARPDLVGTDPSVLHFSIDDLTGEATTVRWSSAPDHENAELSGPGTTAFMISAVRSRKDFGQTRAGTSPEPIIVNGVWGTRETVKAGKIQQVVITWQPVAGLWAQAMVWGTSDDAAHRMVETVRFDRATRCAVPFRLTSIPAGMAVRQCSVSLTRQALRPRLEYAGLWVGDDERYAWCDVKPYDTPPKWKANTTVGAYRVLHAQQTWLFTDKPYVALLSTEGGGNGPIPDSAVRTLIAGFESVGRPDRPATW
jgi:hypothetical protein